jgi:hypothetical protein
MKLRDIVTALIVGACIIRAFFGPYRLFWRKR